MSQKIQNLSKDTEDVGVLSSQKIEQGVLSPQELSPQEIEQVLCPLVSEDPRRAEYFEELAYRVVEGGNFRAVKRELKRAWALNLVDYATHLLRWMELRGFNNPITHAEVPSLRERHLQALGLDVSTSLL